MDKQSLVNQFVDLIEASKNIVFFGGAGVSTESGIPDFRSADGLYNGKYRVPPEIILSEEFFFAYPSNFYDFYRSNMIYLDAKPNITHKVLAALESMGKLNSVITQNIDGLHEAAGSKNVYNLHGSVYQNHCLECGKGYGVEAILNSSDVPRCSCGGIIKPDVVLYGEPLPKQVVDCAIEQIKHADVLVVGGTSLNVYPAASYLRYFKGKNLVLINKGETDFDDEIKMVLHCGLGEVFSVVAERMNLRLD